MSNLKSQKFICLDCETTGLDPKNDRIIEIALMRFDINVEYEQIESLINPQCHIPENSIAIHHITADMVLNKPTIDQLLPDILKLIGDHVIVGHGVGFDIDILANAAERHAIPTTLRKNRFLDTHRMARLYGESPINSLEYLGRHFNIPLEDMHHRAMNDVVVNKEVFKKLARPFKTMEEIFQALEKPIILKTMPFGKFKGRFFNEIPLQDLNGLLRWLINKGFDQDLVHTVRTELKRRKSGNQFHQAANPFFNI